MRLSRIRFRLHLQFGFRLRLRLYWSFGFRKLLPKQACWKWKFFLSWGLRFRLCPSCRWCKALLLFLNPPKPSPAHLTSDHRVCLAFYRNVWLDKFLLPPSAQRTWTWFTVWFLVLFSLLESFSSLWSTTHSLPWAIFIGSDARKDLAGTWLRKQAGVWWIAAEWFWWIISLSCWVCLYFWRHWWRSGFCWWVWFWRNEWGGVVFIVGSVCRGLIGLVFRWVWVTGDVFLIVIFLIAFSVFILRAISSASPVWSSSLKSGLHWPF